MLEDGGVGISVADHDDGVPQTIADRVFEPFCTTNPEGLGLGLSICRTVIEAHSGRLWHESSAGEGSTFHFVPMAVRALQKGAHDFLEKPFEDQRLVYAVLNALRAYVPAQTKPEGTSKRDDPSPSALSAREQEVLRDVLEGRTSRAIADALHISEKTVEFHRARIREKLGVQSLAELFRVCLPAIGDSQPAPTTKRD